MKLKNEKISILQNEPQIKKGNVYSFLEKKIGDLQEIIKKTILSVQKYKFLDILGASEINICIYTLEKLFIELAQMHYSIKEKKKMDIEQMISKLQTINNEISVLFRTFGTQSIVDLISVCFGVDFIKQMVSAENKNKYEIIRKYVHPISYKVIPWRTDKNNDKNNKVLSKNRIVEDFMIVESAQTFDCFDLARTSNGFQTKVYGIKIAIQNKDLKKTLIVCGIVDDIIIHCLNYPYIEQIIHTLKTNKPEDPDFKTTVFDRFIDCLTIKELLIYSTDELYNKYMGHINQVCLMKQKTVSQVVKEFLNHELYGQRIMLIQLLIKDNDPEFQYLAYLLYDILSTDNNANVDTQEQTLLFDSLPWTIKKYFRDAMKQTIQYTNNLSNFDNNKIPLEQQICLLKASDTVKEKAMVKLKEIKSKSEDSGSKARQYLEGLLRIPFGIYREEPILNIMKETRGIFLNLIKKIKELQSDIDIPSKDKYTCLEIEKYSKIIRDIQIAKIREKNISILRDILMNNKRNGLIENICKINSIIKIMKLKRPKLCHSGKKNAYMKESMEKFIDDFKNNQSVLDEMNKCFLTGKQNFNQNINSIIVTEMKTITEKQNEMKKCINKISNTLDLAIYGHENAKRQIERIIGQWMNGEQAGYCFGFEGPPGVGKTSLAKKGLAYCLEDEEQNHRPFSFIAVGGSSNGSTLDGHNYTYVGSTWGRIVDILMDTKCMNPIIFIDELDKVSRTEHGREIIGILTHLVDPTQNTSFHDKYFSGIDLDISKALFIFSYNDVEMIDRVLLDRIHRIKFDPLTLDEKIIITYKYILPEIFQKMGLEDVVLFSKDIIKFIIENYTNESGVRKLKEILFEIIGEINLKILKTTIIQNTPIPIEVSIDDVKHVYLKDRIEVKHKCIHDTCSIGIVNGLWANSLGNGGIIPIEAKFFPTNTFLDLKLTGMQGDVMKESMNVAKTLAGELTPRGKMKTLVTRFKQTKIQGVHIHCPEGAVKKDGPSAGTAITIVLYSLLNEKKIKNHIAITGEINLQGKVTAIGGLDLKILGAIRAGVTELIFPKENEREFQKFMEKNEEKIADKNIIFHQVEDINEVMKLVFV